VRAHGLVSVDGYELTEMAGLARNLTKEGSLTLQEHESEELEVC